MRSWKPRGPSPKLRARLFPATAAAVTPTEMLRHHVAAWLVGASACALLAVSWFNPQAPAVLGLSRGNASISLAVAAFSNQFYAAYLPAGHSLQNRSPSPDLEWTNDQTWSAGLPTGARTRTNLLWQ